MADQRQSGEPGDLPPSVLALGATEQQLDAALAGAAGKIDALQQSVGTSGTGEDSPNLLEEPENESLPAVIDSQLDEIDRLLMEAGEQLGSPDTQGSAVAAPQSTSPRQEAPTPDFMQDLLSSDDPSSPGSAAADETSLKPNSNPAPQRSSKAETPDFMAEFMSESSRPENAARVEPQNKSISEGAQSALPDAAPQTAGSSPPESNLRRVVDGPIYSAADFGVSMLEAVDRPFRRFSSRTKEVFGWLGLIALATAALVFILSLF